MRHHYHAVEGLWSSACQVAVAASEVVGALEAGGRPDVGEARTASSDGVTVGGFTSNQKTCYSEKVQSD